MAYSKETFDQTMSTLSEEKAIQMIGLAGGKNELVDTLSRLARAYNTAIPKQAIAAVISASKRWNKVQKSQAVSYRRS